ncbi:unnamed protein product [Heligmosomoides polygyrus]|uniref:SCP domain-containing protein n=1 Tax=Heligmosomoides polygyrus TaxID=6339 RepID=A0A3P7WKN8_HELPZ|nr:unnamed protein product [Heligmosomoides polygyrus]
MRMCQMFIFYVHDLLAHRNYAWHVHNFRVIYNCEYERIADDYVQGCQRSPPLTPPMEHALNFKALPYNSTSIYIEAATNAVFEWRDKSVLVPATNKFDEKIEELSNILNWKTLQLGCSVQICGGGIIATVACIYEQPPLSAGEEMYIIGEPCGDGGKCTQFQPATCNDFSLCVFNATSSSSTLSTTSANTTTITTTTQSTTRMHPAPGINQICPSNGDMNDRIRQKATDMHNYRRFVARVFYFKN